jgi:hypothetical protein
MDFYFTTSARPFPSSEINLVLFFTAIVMSLNITYLCMYIITWRESERLRTLRKHTIFGRSFAYHNKNFFLIKTDLLCLFFSGCSSKVIKLNIKPFINFTVDFKIFGTNLSWSDTFFQRLHDKSATLGSERDMGEGIGRALEEDIIPSPLFVCLHGFSICHSVCCVTFLIDNREVKIPRFRFTSTGDIHVPVAYP